MLLDWSLVDTSIHGKSVFEKYIFKNTFLILSFIYRLKSIGLAALGTLIGLEKLYLLTCCNGEF